MHILILGGISRSLINFRGPLIQAMVVAGHNITACAGEPEDEVATVLESWGVQFIPVPLARAGMNPLHDLLLCFKLAKLFRKIGPDAILSYTIKPVIWGSLAAHSAGIHNTYALITGLGYAFMDQTADYRLQTADQEAKTEDSLLSYPRRSTAWSPSPASPHPPQPRTKNQEPRTPLKQRLAGWVAKRLYKASLKHSRKVFFQNPDDAQEFITRKLVDPRKTIVVNGSGIDLDQFSKTADLSPSPNFRTLELSNFRTSPKTSFLLIARLLRDKGICEYAEAAAIIKRDYPNTEFLLIGDYDPNPSGLKPADIEAWVNAGTITYHGQQPDVRPFLQACTVYVLPSYREGTPRTVLEAMATGRPIITTDAPGCRETVRFQTDLSAVALAKAEDQTDQTEDHRLKTEDLENQTSYCRPQTADKKAKTEATGTQKTPQATFELQNSRTLRSPRLANPSRGELPPSPQPETCNLKPETHTLSIGSNGILIPRRNAEALAEAMRFFIENPEQITTMGRASRQYAKDRYDVHKVNAIMLREMGLLSKAEIGKVDS